jgi:hypothetical protein
MSGFIDILRSEFLKLRTVRSTLWTLVTAVVSNVVLAALAGIFIAGRLSSAEKAHVDAIQLSQAGVHLSQIAFGVLGVLVITSEYGTGLIRATLAAVPRRRMLLATKAIVFTATALVTGIAASFAAYLVFQASLSGTGTTMRSTLGDPGVLRAVTGGGLYLAALGLLGLGLGAIIRSSAGAIATLFGLLFVPVILVSVLPTTWRDMIGPYLPMNAGEQIYIVHHEPSQLAAWTGFAVFCGYAAAALIAGFIMIKHRDA